MLRILTFNFILETAALSSCENKAKGPSFLQLLKLHKVWYLREVNYELCQIFHAMNEIGKLFFFCNLKKKKKDNLHYVPTLMAPSQGILSVVKDTFTDQIGNFSPVLVPYMSGTFPFRVRFMLWSEMQWQSCSFLQITPSRSSNSSKKVSLFLFLYLLRCLGLFGLFGWVFLCLFGCISFFFFEALTAMHTVNREIVEEDFAHAITSITIFS